MKTSMTSIPGRLARCAPMTLAAVAAAALLGCGGGGGDGGPAPVVIAPRVTISAPSAPNLAAEAVTAGSAGFAGVAAVPVGVQVQAGAAPGPATFAAIAAGVRRVIHGRAPAVLVGITESHTVPCSSGSITTTLNYASPVSDTPGDSFDMFFDNCAETEGTLSGRMLMTLVQTNPTGTLVVADAVLTDLTVTARGIGERTSGSMRMTVDDTSAAQSIIGVTSSNLGYTRYVNGALRSTRTLTDYTYQMVETLGPGSQTRETFAYTVTGNFPVLGEVSWQAATSAPIVTPFGAAHPVSGAGTVTGANGKSVAITVTGTGVHLDIDHSGDSAIDATKDLTWAEFDLLL